MQLTKLIESQELTGASAGAATSIGSATCVRLFNQTAGIVTVGVSTSVGAATTISFEMPAYHVEFLQKTASDVIFTSAPIKANKVGFTH